MRWRTSLAAALALGGGLAVPTPASAVPAMPAMPAVQAATVQAFVPVPTPSGPGIFDVMAFGAVGDGASDDTAAIQSALDATAAAGGWAWLPEGRYRITAPLHVGAAASLMGAGWAPLSPGSATAQTGLVGAWIVVDAALVGQSAIVMAGNGSVVRDLGVWHDQPAAGPGWTPRDYGWAIESVVDDALVRHVWLANPTLGIRAFGRNTVEEVWGQPLTTGIMIDTAYDVVRVRDLTFTPTWSVAPEVLAHQRANAVAVDSRRNDNPELSFLDVAGYATGVLLAGSSAGITAKTSLMEARFRDCGAAIVVDGPGTIGKAARLDIADCDDGVVLRVQSSLTLATVTMRNLGGSAVRTTGGFSTVWLDDVSVSDWARSVPGAAALDAAGAGSWIRVGPARSFQGACDLRIGAGDVTVTDTGPTMPVPAPTRVRADTTLATPGALDASTLGVVGDGSVDDGPALQAALDSAGAGGAGEVRLGPGTYRLDSAITVPAGVTLTGIGWEVRRPSFHGTYLLVPQSNLGVAITLDAGATLRNLAVRHEQPPDGPAWAPFPFDWAVRVVGGGATVRDVFLLNATKGVEVTAAGGDVLVDRLFGEPLTEGLRLDTTARVRVDAVHFWPFLGYDAAVHDGTRPQDWVQASAVAVRIDRAPGAELSNVFAFGYHVGLELGGGGGSATPPVYLWNADQDSASSGVVVSGPGANALIVNAQAQGLVPAVPGIGLHVLASATDARVVLRNGDIRLYAGSAITVEAPTAHVAVDLTGVAQNDLDSGGTTPLDFGSAPTSGIGSLMWPNGVVSWPAIPVERTVACSAPPTVPTAAPAFAG